MLLVDKFAFHYMLKKIMKKVECSTDVTQYTKDFKWLDCSPNAVLFPGSTAVYLMSLYAKRPIIITDKAHVFVGLTTSRSSVSADMPTE